MPHKDPEVRRAYAQARHKAKYADYYAANKEMLQEKSRRWYWANRERAIARAAEWKAANPEKKQGHTRKFNLSKYGISPEEYAALFEKEHGVCAICGAPPPKDRNLDVDHGPDRKSVRGLLCNPCNRGIAAFRDDPHRIAAAIVYLLERK